MAIGILLLFIFFGVLAFFGWQAARFYLSEKKIEVLIPLSFVIGAGFYIFLLNITSYFIPILINFYLIFLILFLLGIALKSVNKKKLLKIEWSLNKKMINLLVLTCFTIMFFSGLYAVRSIESDDLAWSHLPLAASIAGGNFPVKDLIFPNKILAYHYGYNLFYGAVSNVTGVPVWFVSDVVVFLFSGLIFALLFIVSRLIVKDSFKSYVVAFVGMFGGSLSFIYFFGGVVTLYEKFVLHLVLLHPFKFLAQMWAPDYSLLIPLIQQLGIIWASLGLALTLVIIYLYFDFIDHGEQRNKAVFFGLMTILMSTLILIFEYAALIVGLAIVVYLVILYLSKKDIKQFKFLFFHSLFFLLLTTVLSFVQGGMATIFLKYLVNNNSVLGQPVSVYFLKQPFYFRGVFIFGKSAIVDSWGLLYLLIIPASFFIIKKYFKNGLFLVLMSFTAFLIPLVVSFNEMWQASMSKFFYLTNIGWSIIVGIFLVEIKDFFVFKKNIFLQRIIFLFLIVICLSGIFYLFTRWTYPSQPNNHGRKELVAEPSAITELKGAAYSWVRKNTSIRDYFLFFGDPADMKLATRQNYKFVIYAQRIAPTYQYLNDYPDTFDIPNIQTLQYRDLIISCDSNILKSLNYKYLFVDNNWPDGLEKKCLEKNNLDLKFDMKEDGDFVRIYQIK